MEQVKQFMLFGDPDIKRFREKHTFLSNFYPCEIEFENHRYASVEHAYVAAKTTDAGIRSEIRKIKNAGAVKKFGREWIDLPLNWDDIKVDIMETLVRKKFKNQPLGDKLRSTGSSRLFEGNWWGDKFWGVDIETEQGENNLGRILMKIRRELR